VGIGVENRNSNAFSSARNQAAQLKREMGFKIVNKMAKKETIFISIVRNDDGVKC
jgi:hypothetical protein